MLSLSAVSVRARSQRRGDREVHRPVLPLAQRCPAYRFQPQIPLLVAFDLHEVKPEQRIASQEARVVEGNPHANQKRPGRKVLVPGNGGSATDVGIKEQVAL